MWSAPAAGVVSGIVVDPLDDFAGVSGDSVAVYPLLDYRYHVLGLAQGSPVVLPVETADLLLDERGR